MLSVCVMPLALPVFHDLRTHTATSSLSPPFQIMIPEPRLAVLGFIALLHLATHVRKIGIENLTVSN